MTKLTLHALDLSIDLVSTRQELLRLTTQALDDKRRGYFTAINPEKIMAASKNSNLQQVFHSSMANFCDGVGIVMAMSFLDNEKIERMTGIDFFLKILSILDEKKKKLFLFGSQSRVLDRVVQKIRTEYPGIEMVGSRSGYDYNDADVIKQINQTQPDFVAVALGSPKQEEWIFKQGMQSKGGIFMGVGGSFDVMAGEVRRAPWLFQKMGLEWLYRLILQPSRGKRQKNLPIFMALLLKEKWLRIFSRRN